MKRVERWGLWLVDLHGSPIEQWLAFYDPDLPEAEALRRAEEGFTGPGGGLIVTTADPSQAKAFANVREALEEWRRASVAHPLRSDGHPNRPLSAFTVTPRILPRR